MARFWFHSTTRSAIALFSPIPGSIACKDGTIKLLDYRVRYYDPALGRFISPDTIIPDTANPQDWNRYTYVRNNPIVYTDPSGHRLVKGRMKTYPIGGKKQEEKAADVTPSSGVEKHQHVVVTPGLIAAHDSTPLGQLRSCSSSDGALYTYDNGYYDDGVFGHGYDRTEADTYDLTAGEVNEFARTLRGRPNALSDSALDMLEEAVDPIPPLKLLVKFGTSHASMMNDSRQTVAYMVENHRDSHLVPLPDGTAITPRLKIIVITRLKMDNIGCDGWNELGPNDMHVVYALTVDGDLSDPVILRNIWAAEDINATLRSVIGE